MSCGRAREFLAHARVDAAQVVDASKARLGAEEALALARAATELHVSRGKKTIVVDMRTKPSDAELLALLLGPTGRLRAPTLRSGTKLLVGFAPETYAKVLR